MHNIGRTVGEANYEYEGGHEFENPHEFESQEFEGSHEFEGGHEFESQEFESQEYEDEFLNELHELHETSHESHELPHETSHESHEVASEAMEMELATELLGVSNEEEMEQFLGKLVRRAAGAVKSFANSAAGRAIGGVLKAAAKKALPIVGRAAGTFFGGPVGGMIGGQLGNLATRLFELELEGLSNEDKEFEYARAFVRFANDAVRRAAYNPNFRFQPRRIARNSAIAAARRYAPGLLRRLPGRGRGNAPVRPYSNNGYGYGTSSNQGDSGTWYREGNQIILNLE